MKYVLNLFACFQKPSESIYDLWLYSIFKAAMFKSVCTDCMTVFY